MRRAWVASAVFGLSLAVAASLHADVLQEASELRRQLQYDAAAEKLTSALPQLQDEARARALLLLASVNSDPKEARRQLLDAGKAATRPETRREATLALARLDFGRGNYRSVEARLQEFASDPEAALWLGMSAIAVGEKSALRETLEPAGKLDFGQLLLAWTDLQAGDAEAALDRLEPIVRRRRADVAPTALLWKAQAQIARGDRDGAVETTAELRERWGATPEVALAEAAVSGARPAADANAAPSAPSERLALQIGSFEDRTNALRYRERLAREVAEVRVEESQSGAQRFYRVLVGNFASRAEAETYGNTQLTPRGIAWQVVRPGEDTGP
jgi:hypothetical protein